ncbi:SGNH/GDSL hydrolase family protein [Clostridium perfringens]|uniref:SGNH/GDSL hydrolase family protein n=1 Tax=Clostridium perfringens TaxID=1502 RepID=UPI0018E40573|nr:SGNH/GDSL hydrolase family protein [Clostridium perfringens]MBI6052359.1 SGNH/GDSL hydrolase family protein [Clostridium perfringens]
MKEIIVNVDAYNENSIRTVEGDNLSEVYKIYILKNKRRIDLTNKIAVMAYVDEYGSKRSNILNLNITNAAEGEIELPITNIISEHNGVYACQVAIYGENNSLEQTAPFSLIVENNIFSKISNTAINHSDFHILSEAIKTASEYAKKLKDGTEKIELQYAYKLDLKANESDLVIERKRIDNIVSLPEGSTTGDAELADGRVGYNGVVYDTLGNAIRGQFLDSIPTSYQLKFNFKPNGYVVWSTGEISSHDAEYCYSDYIELLAPDKIYIKNLNYKANDWSGLAFYDVNKAYISGYQYNRDTNIELSIPEGAKYIRVTANSSFTNIANIKIYQSLNSTQLSLKSEITDVQNCVNLVEQKTNSLLSEIPLTKKLQGIYVGTTGKLSDSGGKEWIISNPISIPRFSTITVFAKGFKSNVAIISKYVSTDDTYVPLVISEEGKFYYTFTLTEDMNISICSSNTIEWKLYVKNETLLDYFKLIESSVCIPYSVSDVGSYIHYDDGGVIGGTPKLSCTDYVKVDSINSIVIYNLNYRANDGGGLAFYDANKTYISGHQYNRDAHLTVKIPTNAKYLRFTINNNATNSTLLLTNIHNNISNIVNSLGSAYTHTPTCEKNKYINYTNGVETPHDNENLGVTNFIDIELDATVLKITNLNYTANDWSGLAFYDVNKRFISGHQYNRDTNLTLKIPTNAKYLRATVLMTSLDTLTIVTMSSINEGIIKLSRKIEDINNKQLTFEDNTFDYCQIFHRISGIGDSLMSGEVAYYDEELGKNVYTDCYNYSWLSNLCKNIGATATHYSNGGRTTKTWLQDCLATLKNENPKSSAYYIGLGTNDIRYVTLGTIEDCGTDNETFYGMYSKIIREVQAFNPNAKIFCCSLYFNPRGDSVKAYCKAIKEMSEKYKCYYIDFVNRFGNEYSNSNLVSVGHFTNPGYVRVAKQMQQLTNEIIRDNIKDFNFLGIKYKDI